MSEKTLTVRRAPGVAYFTLNRPDAHNALNQQLITELQAAFTALVDDRSVRVVVLAGNGRSFCAGGDLKEMRASKAAGEAAQLEDARRLEAVFTAMIEAPQVVVARVHGAALGGGLGLVCAADFALAAHEAQLGLPEVRLGLAPAIISPYVVARVGVTRARELFLRGVRLDGVAATAAGLVTSAHPAAALDDAVDALLAELLRGGPEALAACKALLSTVAGRPPAATLVYRAALLSRLQSSPEGQAGMQAFAQKQDPPWVI